MEVDRRTLLKTSSLVAGAALLPTAACASPVSSLALGLQEIKSDPMLSQVHSFVKEYSSKVSMVVQPLTDKAMPKVERQCSVQVPIESMERFTSTWNSNRINGFSAVWCEGSKMCFQLNNTFFVLNHTL